MRNEFILPVVFGVNRIYTARSPLFASSDYSSRMVIAIKWWEKANKIRREKKRQGEPMTYADIAVALGVSQPSVGHWFVGRRPAPVPMVEGIALHLGVPVAELFMPDDAVCVTDEKLKSAIKLWKLLPENQKSMLVPKVDTPAKRKGGRTKKRAA